MVYDMVYKEGKNLVSDKQSVEIAKRISLNDYARRLFRAIELNCARKE